MTDNTEHAQVGWSFWLKWVFASIVGLAVGFAVGRAVVSLVGRTVASLVDFDVGVAVLGAVFGVMVGASLGIAQWLVLRRQVSRTGWWILASAAGFSVGGAVTEVVDFAVLKAGDLGVDFFVAFLVGGAVREVVVSASLGIAQWLVLRRHVSRAAWWVLASTVGGAAGFAIGGFVYGVITGAVMVWLLRQPVSEEPSLPEDAT